MLSGNIPAVSARDTLLIDADCLDEIQVMMQHLHECPPLQTQHTYSTAIEETTMQIQITVKGTIMKL